MSDVGNAGRSMSRKSYPTVGIVLLTYNSIRWIEACLSTVLQSDYPNLKVLVIDNASRDGTFDAVRSRFPQLQVTRNRKNVGCAEGNNMGISWALGNGMTYVLILNPDTKIAEDCVSTLVRVAESHPSYGVLSPFQFTYDGRHLDENFAYNLDHSPFVAKNQGEILPVAKIIGAAMLLRCSMVTQVGGFDPVYFTYGEESDLCRRSVYHGWRLGVVRAAKVCHWHRLVQDRRQNRANVFAYRAEHLKALKDLTRGGRQRLGRYLRLALSDLRLMRRGRNKFGWHHFLRAHAYVLANLLRLDGNVRKERAGPCHLPLRGVSSRAREGRELFASVAEE